MATTVLDHYRIRNDDGNETGATWIAAVDTEATVDVDVNYRVRCAMDETSGMFYEGDPPPAPKYELQYNRNLGGWNQVTGSSSVVQIRTSPWYANGSCTQQISAPRAFKSGAGLLTETLTADLLGKYRGRTTEAEFCVQTIGADVAHDDAIIFRLVRGFASGQPFLLESYPIAVSTKVNKPAVAVARLIGLDLDVTYTETLARLIGLDLDATYTETLARLIGLDLDLTFTETIARLIGLDLDATYTETVARLIGLDLDLEYATGPARLIGLDLDVTYTETLARLIGLDLDATYEETLARLIGLDVDATYSETIARLIGLDLGIVYSALFALPEGELALLERRALAEPWALVESLPRLLERRALAESWALVESLPRLLERRDLLAPWVVTQAVEETVV